MGLTLYEFRYSRSTNSPFYYLCGMKKIGYLLLWAITWPALLSAQKELLQSGPMLGYVNMKEVLLWAQTNQTAAVQFEYWPTDQPKDKHWTEVVNTEKKSGYTAKCVADEVEPGTAYTYQLYINKKKIELPYPTTFKTQTLWQWRTDPPAFSVATGSCNYINEAAYDRPGTPYGSEHQIFTQINAQKPDLMIWLGDNTYLREPDWGTRTGIYHRYTHDRSLPELQPLLASTAHYATWDDHDYGPNDADGSFVNKEITLEAFTNFWGNPNFGLGGVPGCGTAFQYNDVDFILLDNRYHRTPNQCEQCPDRTILGAAQLKWLKEALAASQAPFKLVGMGGQFLSTNVAHETYINLCPAERDSILSFIERENIKNVVFLSGDRHFSELSQHTNAKGNAIYELTASSLTAGSYRGAVKEQNAYRVEGTVVDVHNFAMMRFSGPRKERVLEISMYDKDGKVLWTKSIASQK
jgi:alkaline phosphatase D